MQCLLIFALVLLTRPKRNALFHIELMMDNVGVHYNTNLNSYETVLLALFDKGIQSTQNIPQLEKVSIILFLNLTGNIY